MLYSASRSSVGDFREWEGVLPGQSRSATFTTSPTAPGNLWSCRVWLKVASLVVHVAAAAAADYALHLDPLTKPDPKIRLDFAGYLLIAFAFAGIVISRWLFHDSLWVLAFLFLRVTAASVGSFALLKHHPLGCVLLFCTGAVAMFVLACVGITVRLWDRISRSADRLASKAPSSSMTSTVSEQIFRAKRTPLSFVLSLSICFTAAAAGAMWIRSDALSLSTQIGGVEHLALFMLSGASSSVLFVAAVLIYLWASDHSGHSCKNVLMAIMQAFAWSFVIHVGAFVAAPAATLAAPFLLVFFGAVYLVLRAGAPSAKKDAEIPREPARADSRAGLAGLLTGDLQRSNTAVLPGSRSGANVAEEDEPSRADLQPPQDQQAESSRFCQALIAVLLILLSLVQAVGLFIAFLFDVHLVKRAFAQQEETRDLCSATNSSTTVAPDAASANIGEAVSHVLQSCGLESIAPSAETMFEKVGELFSNLASMKADISGVLYINCVALRRLASAIVLWAALLLATVVAVMDLLSVLHAGVEVAGARAAVNTKTLVGYLLSLAYAQGLHAMSIYILQLTINTGVSHSRDFIGIFDRCRGYIVEQKHLAWDSCPNLLHPYAEVVADVAISAGVLCSIVLLISVAGGWLYGLSPAHWAISTFFGSYLKLASFVQEGHVDEDSDDAGTGAVSADMPTSKSQGGIGSRLLAPFAFIPITFGIWTGRFSNNYSIAFRQEWFEPAGAPGSPKLVTWKSMYDATATAISVAWLVLPFGALFSRGAIYLNQYVVFAFGSDSYDGERDLAPISSHFYEEGNADFFLHALNWGGMVVQFLVLVIIESGILKAVDKESHNTMLMVLGICILTVLGFAICRVVVNVVMDSMSFGFTHEFVDCCNLLLRSGALHDIAHNFQDCALEPRAEGEHQIYAQAAIRDFTATCDVHRKQVVQAARELLELPWASRGELLEQQRAELVAFATSSSRARKRARRITDAPKKAPRASVSSSTPREALQGSRALEMLVILREVADADVICALAPREAKRQAAQQMRAALQPRGVWLKSWARRGAEMLAMEEIERQTSNMPQLSPDEEAALLIENPMQVRVSFSGVTHGRAAVTAKSVKSGREIGQQAICRGSVSIKGVLHAKPGPNGPRSLWLCAFAGDGKQDVTFDMEGSDDCNDEARVDEDAKVMHGGLEAGFSPDKPDMVEHISGARDAVEHLGSVEEARRISELERVCNLCASGDGLTEQHQRCCSCCGRSPVDDQIIALGGDMDGGVVRRSWHLQPLALKWEALTNPAELLTNPTFFESKNGVSWAVVVEYEGPDFSDAIFSSVPSQMPMAPEPSQQTMNIQLQVTVIGVSGLDRSSHSGLHCLGRFRGRIESEWTTHTVTEDDFTWNHVAVMPNFTVGDVLELMVRSSDEDVLGWTVLPSASIYPQGYEGHLDLRQEGAAYSSGALHVVLEFSESLSKPDDEDDISECSSESKSMSADVADDYHSKAFADPDAGNNLVVLSLSDAERKPISMLEEAIDSMRKLGVSAEKLAAAEAKLQHATDALHARKARQAPAQQGVDDIRTSLRLAVGCDSDGSVSREWPPPHVTAETVQAAIIRCMSSSVERSAILAELEMLFDICSVAWCNQRGCAAEGVGSDILSTIEEGLRVCLAEIQPAVMDDEIDQKSQAA